MLKNLFYNNFFSGIIFIALGLLLLINPGISILAVVYYIGISKAITGILGLYSHFRKEKKTNFDFGLDILDIIFGLALILSPMFTAVLVSIVPIVIGVWAIIKGCVQIMNSFKYKETIKRWWIFLILGIITLVFGLFITFNPIEAVADLVQIIGGFYLVMGGFVIYNYISDKRNENPDVIG